MRNSFLRVIISLDKPQEAIMNLSKNSNPSGMNLNQNPNWIQGAIKSPEALHKQMGIPQGEKIPASRLASAADKGGKLGERARFAETMKGLRK